MSLIPLDKNENVKAREMWGVHMGLIARQNITTSIVELYVTCPSACIHLPTIPLCKVICATKPKGPLTNIGNYFTV